MTVTRYGIRREDNGRFTICLPDHERSVLVSLPGEVSAIARAGDKSARRLFPPAYIDDLDAEAEYARLMRPELMDGYVEQLSILERTACEESISEDEAMAWIQALNAIRLVVGTKLDVQEGEEIPDPESVGEDDVRAQGMLLYGYLAWLLSEMVEAISP